MALQRRIELIGLRDALAEDRVEIVEPLTRDAVFTAPATARAASAEALAGRWGASARTAPDVASALALASQIAGREGVVVACGSLYIAGEALEAAGADGGPSSGGKHVAYAPIAAISCAVVRVLCCPAHVDRATPLIVGTFELFRNGLSSSASK